MSTRCRHKRHELQGKCKVKLLQSDIEVQEQVAHIENSKEGTLQKDRRYSCTHKTKCRHVKKKGKNAISKLLSERSNVSLFEEDLLKEHEVFQKRVEDLQESVSRTTAVDSEKRSELDSQMKAIASESQEINGSLVNTTLSIGELEESLIRLSREMKVCRKLQSKQVRMEHTNFVLIVFGIVFCVVLLVWVMRRKALQAVVRLHAWGGATHDGRGLGLLEPGGRPGLLPTFFPAGLPYALDEEMTRRGGPAALVALLLALCTTSAAQQKLSIAEKECLLMERGNHTHRHMSRTITVYENDPAYLHCKIPVQGHHLVAWTRVSDEALLTAGQQSFTSDARFQVSQRSSNDWVLIVRRVERDDEGCYLCEVNTEPTSTIYPVFLRVTEKPNSEAAQVAESSLPHKKSSKLLARMNGDEVILNCTVEIDGGDSVGAPEVQWTKDGRLIKIDDSQKYISKVKRGSNVLVHELRIRSPSSNDDGYYACEGQNIPKSAQMVHVNTSLSQQVASISSILTFLVLGLTLL
ncbi:hypothetical protein QR680_013545 [Steinernema hermaphroditum]|uniref:Ig-like domain-containing protein n=1 Tax=Steinernema hermaphroditum TaxID=289476 RepID=A0AA39I5W7_9BILA|nr:hypothetical protein QR680_013545 [Steinernema hermaphroditum]